MALVFQILIGIALLAGLASIFLSAKNWHWTQIVLVAFILMAAAGVLYMSTKTVSMHKKLRASIPRLTKEVAELEARNEVLVNGADDQTGIRELEHQLRIKVRQRGRVWGQVQPVGQMDNQDRVDVEVLNPQAHGIEQDAIVFAFESGPPNIDAPENGPQYLGEFRVVEVRADGAKLEPIRLLNTYTRQRLARSTGPWRLYETMPVDRHEMFAKFSEEQLRQLLPATSVGEYIRHGSPATADDDQWQVIGLDENDQRVGPDDIATAVKRLYNRPLRDYAYLFSELAEQRVVMLTSIEAVTADNHLKESALASAEKLSAFREEEISQLNQDLAGMQQDRKAIQSHRNSLLIQLKNANEGIRAMLVENSAQAEEHTQTQLDLLRHINSTAPQPAGF